MMMSSVLSYVPISMQLNDAMSRTCQGRVQDISMAYSRQVLELSILEKCWANCFVTAATMVTAASDLGMGSVPFHGGWCEMERNWPSVMKSRVIPRNPAFLVPCEMV